MNRSVSSKDTSLGKYKSYIPLYILICYQSFITTNDLRVFALCLYLLSASLSILTSFYYPIKTPSPEQMWVQALWKLEEFMLPCTVILAVAYVDSVIGFAVVIAFLKVILRDLGRYNRYLAVIFVFVNFSLHSQERLIQDTLAIDSHYNHKRAYVFINCLSIFLLSYRRENQGLSATDLGFSTVIVLQSRAWTTSLVNSIPLMLNWFNSDSYEFLFWRVSMTLGLLGTVPEFQATWEVDSLETRTQMNAYLGSFTVASSLGISLALLGGPTLLLLFLALLRLFLETYSLLNNPIKEL